MNKKKLLFIFGTRPEAIKMAPLIKKAESDNNFEVLVCVTAQHRQMLDQVLDFFSIKPDYDLNIMTHNQDLSSLTSDLLVELQKVLREVNPDLVFVQGDTTTAFVGALASFYNKTKVAHIEAGLRSYDKLSPYPEEMYRIMVSDMAHYHFAPTKLSEECLKRENVTGQIHVVGNTVIDALFLGLDIIKSGGEQAYYDYFNFLDFNKQLILITGHRRENFGKPLENVCHALKTLARTYPNIQFVYPVHLNPNVKEVVGQMLGGLDNIILIEPLDYPRMIWLMDKAYIIITDSGGIQEEAPSLGKPVLVTRSVTERVEGIEAGTAKLVGTDTDLIVNETKKLIEDAGHYKAMSEAHNPYGDGKAAEYVIEILKGTL